MSRSAITGLRFSNCKIGMRIKVIGDDQVLTIVDLHPDNQMITYSFRDHTGKVVEHMMEPHLYVEA